MKNLHLLPTGKASRLFDDGMELYIGKLEYRKKHPVTNYNFYVTNDDEINDCWVFNSQRNEVYFCKGWYGKQSISKKIILTTDVDLIKDGVQSIDDNELEWLVKNPNCEEVKVIKHLVWQEYKIIIPKEERKKNFYCGDEVDYDEKCLEQCDGCNDATGVDYGYLPEEKPKKIIEKGCPFDEPISYSFKKEHKQVWHSFIKSINGNLGITSNGYWKDVPKEEQNQNIGKEILPQQIWNKEKMEGIKQLIQDNKKETLEEFIKKLYLSRLEDCLPVDFEDGIKLGIKWQMENSYSEEDMKNAFLSGCQSERQIKPRLKCMEEWFNKIKKK